MGAVDDVDAPAKASPLYAKYATRVDNQSARELLAARLAPPPPAAKPAAGRGRRPSKQKAAASATGGIDAVGGFLKCREGKAIERQVVRGMFGMLKKSF